MKQMEHAAARVALAHELGRPPIRWIATEAFAAEMELNGQLHGLLVERGTPRWGAGAGMRPPGVSDNAAAIAPDAASSWVRFWREAQLAFAVLLARAD